MTTPDPARPPLWRAMESAFLKGRSPGFNDKFGYAAELRAIADEAEKIIGRCEYCDDGKVVAEWLRAEANRAEKGE